MIRLADLARKEVIKARRPVNVGAPFVMGKTGFGVERGSLGIVHRMWHMESVRWAVCCLARSIEVWDVANFVRYGAWREEWGVVNVRPRV